MELEDCALQESTDASRPVRRLRVQYPKPELSFRIF